jgi:hypothetical protein
MKFLCNFIKKICDIKNVWRFPSMQLSEDEAIEMFYHAEGQLPFGSLRSAKGIHRRPRQVSWRTMVKYLRAKSHTKE